MTVTEVHNRDIHQWSEQHGLTDSNTCMHTHAHTHRIQAFTCSPCSLDRSLLISSSSFVSYCPDLCMLTYNCNQTSHAVVTSFFFLDCYRFERGRSGVQWPLFKSSVSAAAWCPSVIKPSVALETLLLKTAHHCQFWLFRCWNFDINVGRQPSKLFVSTAANYPFLTSYVFLTLTLWTPNDAL